MKNYKCIIVDDEELARKLLENYVSRIQLLELVGMAKNSLEANELILQNAVDILFLDIQMPDISGIEFVKLLDIKPQIIFTTAYPEYALDGFDLNVTDYLLKPFSFERFLSGVNKAIEQIKLKSLRSSTAPQTESSKLSRDFIIVKTDQKLLKIKYDELVYIEGMKEYVAFHTANERIIGLYSLKQLILDLPDHFLRIHRSYIVNKKFAKGIEGPFVHLDDLKLPIGKSYKKDVLVQLFD